MSDCIEGPETECNQGNVIVNGRVPIWEMCCIGSVSLSSLEVRHQLVGCKVE